MSFSTVMVHLELEHSNDARLQIAGDFAEQFDAKLIGITAADAHPTHYASGAFAQGLIQQLRADLKNRMEETEASFRAAAQRRAQQIEWRCANLCGHGPLRSAWEVRRGACARRK